MNPNKPEILAKANEALDELKSNKQYKNLKLLAVVVSGAHLFQTDSLESDIDLRGVYAAPAERLLGIEGTPKPIEFKYKDVECSFQELGRFVELMLQPNMNFIEQIKSPLRVVWTKEADILLKISNECISKEVFPHIQGMSIHTWKHAEKEHFMIPKRDLYLYREILRGLILFRDSKFISGVVDQAEQWGDEKVKENVNLLLDTKRKGEKVPVAKISSVKKQIEELQNEMIRLKTFGTLRDKPLYQFSKINKIVIDMRMKELLQ